LEQEIDGENLMYADDDEDTTPPPRPKWFTISYAQVFKYRWMKVRQYPGVMRKTLLSEIVPIIQLEIKGKW
jgi:hypothetical protein